MTCNRSLRRLVSHLYCYRTRLSATPERRAHLCCGGHTPAARGVCAQHSADDHYVRLRRPARSPRATARAKSRYFKITAADTHRTGGSIPPMPTNASDHTMTETTQRWPPVKTRSARHCGDPSESCACKHAFIYASQLRLRVDTTTDRMRDYPGSLDGKQHFVWSPAVRILHEPEDLSLPTPRATMNPPSNYDHLHIHISSP